LSDQDEEADDTKDRKCSDP